MSCDIPAFGHGVGDSGWSAAQGTTPSSQTCPSADLSAAPSEGFASTIFSPEATSAPELFEQVLSSKDAKKEYAILLQRMRNCRTFKTEEPIRGFPASLKPIVMPHYANESAGFLQTVIIQFGAPANLHVKLLMGSEFIRVGALLVIVAYFPSTSSFKPSQLARFIPPVLAKL